MLTNTQRTDALYLKLARGSVDRAAFIDALTRAARVLVQSFTQGA